MKEFITEIAVPTLITEGSRVQGNLTFLTETQVHGIVEGDVFQQTVDKISVGRTGWIKGALNATGPITIEGRVDGDVHSSVLIRLTSTAMVKGTLSAPQIDVRPGALFEGEFKMRSSAKARVQAKQAA